jgi:DNA-binding response OmpR family regulator
MLARPMRVLVVEDQQRLARALAEGLRREGMAVDVSLNGTDAAGRVVLTPYDVVVLDRDLPDSTVTRSVAGSPRSNRKPGC